ncbi:AMP-binding protein [Streptomyces lonarensis]|uniref:AMP-binding protein n=1 Tax=Streptomyces lonarensis TaxID=700599 RepID=A0A7X6CYC8_9ACTN|nr:AMP-binding protein [Streptomyces lonarensis]NJQ04839.1 AMP-binding protein [Streptomyces lonarensis]
MTETLIPTPAPRRGVPPAEECVIGRVLERRAGAHPDRPFARFPDGASWSYRDAWDRARSAAVGLRELGVVPGDAVASWLPNGPEALAVWFGTNLNGGVHVPLNTAYRGSLLAHALKLSGARVLVVHAELADRLALVDLAAVEHVVVVRGEAPAGELPARVHGPEVLARSEEETAAYVPAEVHPWDTQSILLTSGTTGASKGAMISYAASHASATAGLDGILDHDDRYLLNLPLFHAGGTLAAVAMLSLGGSVAVVQGFSTEEFWEVVRENGVTVCTLLSVMMPFLTQQPPGPQDRDHPLRTVLCVPLPDDVAGFAERFGVAVHTVYNSTETSTPIISPANPVNTRSCGRLRPGVEARIVDDHDQEVPEGEVGELVLRTEPWGMSHGYHAMPEATATTWRHGWFHTGDAFRRDGAGDYYFVDRIKDAIRRRGENISSVELEAEIRAFPAVGEAAVVAVPSPQGEDDVLAVVVAAPGAVVDPVALTEFLVERVPYYMVPRFVRTLGELPLTPTGKVRKFVLREEGVTDGTWDRESSGVRVRRERLS